MPNHSIIASAGPQDIPASPPPLRREIMLSPAHSFISRDDCQRRDTAPATAEAEMNERTKADEEYDTECN
jgi:hypothetical protein